MGWVRGLGLQLLKQTIQQLQPTFLLALSSPQQQQQQQQQQQLQLATAQSVTPSGRNSPYGGATSGEESDEPNLAGTSGVAPSSSGSGTAAIVSGSPKSKSRPALNADDRDIAAFRGLAKENKASFLPLPPGSGNGNDNNTLGKPGRVLTAVELRSLALLAYFRTPSACSRYATAANTRMTSGHSLSQWLPPTSPSAAAAASSHVQRPLVDRTPYAIRWCDVRIGFTHDRPPNSQAMVALNGSLVGLVIDPTQYAPGPGPSQGTLQLRAPQQNERAVINSAAEQAYAQGLPGILAQPPAHCFGAPPSNSGGGRFPTKTHCVGLGLVSRIDPVSKHIFVITPIPHSAVRRA